MCTMRKAVEGHPSLRMILWSLFGNELWRIVTSHYGSQQSFPTDFSLLVPQNCRGTPVVHKIVFQWVPKLLTPERKANCMESALIILQRYHDDGDEFLDQIITGDETWVAHIVSETKLLLMHWCHSRSPCKTKFKPNLSVHKVMCMVF